MHQEEQTTHTLFREIYIVQADFFIASMRQMAVGRTKRLNNSIDMIIRNLTEIAGQSYS